MSTTSSARGNRADDSAPKAIAVVIALTALSVTLLTTFALPAIHTSARGLPIGVVGSPAQVEQVEQLGEGTDVITYPDEPAAREAILDRHAYGAVVFDMDGSVETVTASAAITAAASMIQQIGVQAAAVTGTAATTSDVRAFPSGDPHGVGLSAGALPLALGGWIAARAIMFTVRGPVLRVLTALGFALAGALAMTAMLRFVTGTFDENYLLTSLGAALGIAATSIAVLGLRSLLGGIGIAIAAVALIALGNPLSGLASAPEMLPSPWGALGQLLPPGATGSLLRSLAFFGGAGALHPLVVLTCWLLGGAVLYLAAVLRPATEPQPPSINLGDERAVDFPRRSGLLLVRTVINDHRRPHP